MRNKFIIALLVTILMALAEYIFSTNESLSLGVSEYFKTYFLVFIVLCTTYLSNSRILGGVLITLIVLGSGINIIFNQYFGRYLMPYDIAMFFTEIEDTTKGLLGGLSIFMGPLLWFLALYIGALIYVFLGFNPVGKVKYIFQSLSVIFLILFFLPVMKGKNFENNVHYSVVRNSIGVYGDYMGNLLKNKNSIQKNYLPYTVDKTNQSVNVVMIMGESANFKHMSLYGYERETTPYLNSLSQLNGFKFYRGVSRGFSTRIGVPLTLNVLYEPDNTKQLLSLETNLFNLAKQNGFNTYYLSNQKSGVLASLVNAQDIDEFHDISSKQMPKDNTNDMRLLEIYQNFISQSDKPFFTVLHQRNHHFAYDENYPKQYEIYKKSDDEFQNLINTYDNSMRFQDDFFRKLVETTRKITDKPTLIVYTSDHSELFGEKGLWGHGAPIVNSAGVPMFVYAVNGADQWLKDPALPQNCALSNYQLGKFVAKALGWNIHNPNEKQDFVVNIALPYDNAEAYKVFKVAEVTQEFCQSKISQL